ncbi:MAG: methyltransferase family protein [Candidatus Dormibacteraceae bacterium]
MTVNLKMLIIQVSGMFLVCALALFLAAGTVAWPAGWLFLVLFFGSFLALILWLMKHNPGLLMERLTGFGNPGQKSWDKVFYVFLTASFFAWWILMPLDGVRFHWSQMPELLQVIGVILLLCSFYFLFLTFKENSFLSPVVRLQTERGQTVVSTGPYHYMRHPMYAACAIFVIGSALLLGSWYGLLGGLIFMLGLAIRAVLEERTLREELQGYDVYMEKVRYRIIPYVW